MNWEETVIKLNCGGILSDIEVEYYNRGAEAQAKATWEIAEKEGMRKVVEFIQEEFGGYTRAVADGGELLNILIDNYYGEDGSLDKWQAQLKEWGLEEMR